MSLGFNFGGIGVRALGVSVLKKTIEGESTPGLGGIVSRL
jgi:hypothetical protein